MQEDKYPKEYHQEWKQSHIVPKRWYLCLLPLEFELFIQQNRLWEELFQTWKRIWFEIWLLGTVLDGTFPTAKPVKYMSKISQVISTKHLTCLEFFKIRYLQSQVFHSIQIERLFQWSIKHHWSSRFVLIFSHLTGTPLWVCHL